MEPIRREKTQTPMRTKLSFVPSLAYFSIGYDENVCSTYCLCQQRLALSQYSLFLSVNTKVDMRVETQGYS